MATAPPAPLAKLAIAIEYRGTAYHGWQSQPNGATVQDAVERALSQIAQSPIRVFAAGRTDAGVHATLMPAHFVGPASRQPTAWLRGANAHLPRDIKLLWARRVRDDFHARHRAASRHYQYLLQNRPQKPGLFSDLMGHCHVPLDLSAMRLAARHLRGEHDFSAFRASSCQAKTPIRRLHHIRIAKRGDIVIFHFHGNGFLHHMTRNIVGALLDVGRGRRPPPWLRTLRQTGDRTQAPPTAPAAGLYFCGAEYPPLHTQPLPPTLQFPPLPR